MRKRVSQGVLLVGSAAGLYLGAVIAQEVHTPVRTPADARSAGLDDLRTATNGNVPQPDLSQFLNPGKEKQLQQLGKMLFWDVAVGSDGQSCASCHFHAGVDNRVANSVSPGLMRMRDERDNNNPKILGYHTAESAPDVEFHTKGPNVPLALSDFPLTTNPGEILRSSSDSAIVLPAAGNSNDGISSAGVISKAFVDTQPMVTVDDCSPHGDNIFNVGGSNTRQVPPRNAPTVINAVFNAFNFWDGRANHYFNGQNVFGVLDPDAFVLMNDGNNIVKTKISLPNSSLASQAVGPILSTFEESCGDGTSFGTRTSQHIGKKLLRTDQNGNQGMYALSTQVIDRFDSLIGQYSKGNVSGSTIRYRDMIKQVFQEKWWLSDERRILLEESGILATELQAAQAPFIRYPEPVIVDASSAETANPDDDGVVDDNNADFERFTLMEMNFPLFFGLAVQAYESTLIADDSPFDRWMRDGRLNGKFNSSALRGLDVFVNEGSCANCHGGPEMTNASVRNFQQGNNLIEPMIMSDNNFALYDNGFYNIGVSPTVDDLGRGGRSGPAGQRALAVSRQLLAKQNGLLDIPHPIIGDDKVPAFSEDAPDVAVCNDSNGDGFCSNPEEPISEAFQRAAVDGAFKTPGLRNIELQGPYFHQGSHITLAQVVEFYDNGGNFCRFNQHDLDPDIKSLELTSAQKRDLVAFMVSLTDERVRRKKAPFDHPSLKIPQDGTENGTINLPAVGRSGVRSSSQWLRPVMRANHNSLGSMPTGFECSIGEPNG